MSVEGGGERAFQAASSSPKVLWGQGGNQIEKLDGGDSMVDGPHSARYPD